MLKQRVITALVLLPLVLVLFLMVPLHYFATAVVIIVYLIALEWAKLAGIRRKMLCSLYAVAVSTVNLGLWFWGGDFRFWPSLSWPNLLVWDYPMIAVGAAMAGLGISIFIVLTYSRFPKWWASLAFRGVLGFTLLPAFFVSLVSIRSVGYASLSESDFYYGGQLLLMMFCMIWAADTGAYLAGKMFGKRKLAPVVSPNKTWEGAVGGLLLSVTVAWLGVYFLRLDIQQPVLYTLVALILATISVLGDLFESALKRAANIKDSGNLLPGHGGMFDRLDSSIAVAPGFFLTFSYFGWF